MLLHFTYIKNETNSNNLHLFYVMSHCTMLLPISITILEKNHFMLIFYPKIIIFSLDDANCPNFRRNVGFHICCPIFVKLFAKKRERGVWQIWNLPCRAFRSCREKKFKIAFLSDQPFTEQISSKYLLPSLSWNGYLARLLLPTFNSSSIHSSHPIFILLFCKFADYGPAINSHPNL